MPQSSKARAAATIDAICDDYERAYLAGEFANCFEPWLNRVEPEQRSWLLEELLTLHEDLHSARTKIGSVIDRPTLHETFVQVPEGVDTDVWTSIANTITFRKLSNAVQKELALGFEVREFDPGDYIIVAGESASGLYLITAGEVDVLVTEEEGQRHRLDEDTVGGVLGEMSLLTGHLSTADVIATTPVKTLVLPTEAYQRIRAEHPELEIALSQVVCDRLGHRSRDALCGKVLGGYQLKRCISSGAMGVVYEATRPSDGTTVALKMLRHRFLYNNGIITRFDQEADLLAQLEDPNIVGFQDHFVEYRTRFIVLDYYDGSDLREVLRRMRRLPETTVRGLLGQIASGLLAAHQSGVLHLDLKPANILINKSGNVAITDFGLGRLIQSDASDRHMVGTPLYMPPEQFTMKDIGPPCDWYSFGCIAAELLTGERLFSGQTNAELMQQKTQVPSSHWPSFDVSEDLRLHINCALQPMTDHRDLDLAAIAEWARPLPELVWEPEKPPLS